MKQKVTDQTVEIVPEAPSHLSERARQLWVGIVPGRARSVGRLALLTIALEALDRGDEAARIIKQEGLTTITEGTKACHAHPAVKIEREARSTFAKIWGRLGLEWDDTIDGKEEW